MSPELTAVAAFAIAALATFVTTPLAIALAVRTSFFDLPAGYKGHKRPTPYLGGTAIMVGIVAASAAVGGIDHHWTIVLCAVAIWLMGTADDRVGLPILVRLGIEVIVALVLWGSGHGWTIFHNGAADLILTVLWYVGVMNAFNLMDNMDGAAATTAAVSALGAGTLALVSGRTDIAPLCFGVAGAAAGFLPANLARPARIFMGDGGSLLLGLLVARVTADVVSREYLGPSGVVVAALLVAIVILDTTLVTISRSRAGRSVFSGGRDHLTHRLSHRLETPRNVALTLAVTQVAVCGITIGVAQAGVGWVLLAGAAATALGGLMIWQFERSPLLGKAEVGADEPVAVGEAVQLAPVRVLQPSSGASAASAPELAN